MSGLWRRLGSLRRRPGFEREMEEEMTLHLDQEIADRIAAGADPAEARRTAFRDFGRVAEMKEAAREVRGVPRLENGLRDLRWTVRGLRRTPGAPVVAAVTLALAVAAITTVGAVIERVLLAPLPYPAPDRLAVAWERRAGSNTPNVVSVPNFEAWRERLRTFTDLAGLVPDYLDLQVGRPERIAGAAVSAAWFRIIGVPPAMGRGVSEEEATGGAAVIVLSHALWREQFGADPRMIGRAIHFGDKSRIVVGVMPAGFEPPAFGWLGPGQRYWLPFAPNPDNRQWGRFLLVLGRLRPDASVATAGAELTAVAAGWRARTRPTGLGARWPGALETRWRGTSGQPSSRWAWRRRP